MTSKHLRTLGDGLTVVVAAFALIILGARYLGSEDVPSEPTGVYLDSSIGIDFAASPRTLVLVLSQECGFCQDSMPFYERLTSIENEAVQIVVAAPPSEPEIAAYLTSEGVEPDALVFTGLDSLPVPGTPSLLAVDPSGLITHAWIGLLGPEREEDVLSTLFSQ